MSLSSKTRWGVAFGVPAAMVLSVMAVLPASSAEAAPAAPAAPTGDTLVSLGDSYMSGEGVIYANHNFPGTEPSTTSSNWQTAGGSLGGKVSNDKGVPTVTDPGNVWRSVFGDANGYPDKGGVESIPWCDRSYASPGQVGDGWQVKNLACSGAESQSKNSLYEQTLPCLFSCYKFQKWKPGVDFKQVDNPTPAVANGVGQAKLLQDFAGEGSEIEVVALSIGGNDFGFGEIGATCIKQASIGGGRCENDADIQKLVEGEANLKKTADAVTSSIENITTAMARAGYEQDDWKLVYQNPPLPVGMGKDTKYEFGLTGGTRGSIGGCGLADSTLDWVVETVYPNLTGALKRGLVAAKDSLGKTQVIALDTERTFENHLLCGKDTIGATNYKQPKVGKYPEWQDDNGKKTEWVTEVNRIDSLTGNPYQQQMPLHPNYWGQRALSACMSAAVESEGPVMTECLESSGRSVDEQNRPKMNLSGAEALWIVAGGKPVIQGKPNVGQELSADTDGVFLPESTTYAYEYQWFADGAAIDGATGRVFTPEASHLGETVTVRVTASAGDLEPAASTSDGVVISDLVVTELPAITGTPRVGSLLSVSNGTYSATPDSVTFQWLEEGEPIAGATAATYEPKAEQQGKRLSVRVTVAKAGFITLVLNTEETEEIAKGVLTVSGAPAITGSPTVGQTLTAEAAGVSFTPSAERLEFQWYRGDSLIPGPTGSTYELTGDDVGQVVSVRVVGHADGYAEAISDRSAPTAAVSRGKITRVRDARLKYVNEVDALRTIPKKKARYGNDLRLDLMGVFSEYPESAVSKWYIKTSSGKKRVRSVDWVTYRPKKRDIGSRVMATVTTDVEGYEQASAKTPWYKIIKGKHVPVKAPKIKIVTKAQATRAKVGVPLVTTRAVFLPRTSDVQYQWLRGSSKIKGADSRRYVPTSKDVGKTLRVRAYVPAGKGFVYSQVTSKPTKPVKKVKGLG